MPSRRRKKPETKAHTSESRNVGEALAKKLDTALTLSDKVADAVVGLHGFDLANKLHEESVRLFTSGEVDEMVTSDARYAFRLVRELKCAGVADHHIPQPLIPFVVWRKIDQLDTIKGRFDLGNDCDAMTVGKLLVDLTDSCINRASENIGIAQSATSDTVWQPFMDIQGLRHVQKYANTDEMCMLAFLVKNIVPAGINAVSVKPSPIHGNGVFAKRSVKKGHIMTMYPCDAFSFCADGTSTIWAMANGDTMLRTMASLFAMYCAEINPTRIAIAGDPDKYTNDSCGHLINDGSCILKTNFGMDEVLRYVKESTSKQNCHFIPLGGAALAVVASRNINAGEEVLAAYGAAFWSKYAHGDI